MNDMSDDSDSEPEEPQPSTSHHKKKRPKVSIEYEIETEPTTSKRALTNWKPEYSVIILPFHDHKRRLELYEAPAKLISVFHRELWTCKVLIKRIHTLYSCILQKKINTSLWWSFKFSIIWYRWLHKALSCCCYQLFRWQQSLSSRVYNLLFYILGSSHLILIRIWKCYR